MKLPNILEKIVETKKEEVASLKKYSKDFEHKADDTPDALDFKEVLDNKYLSVIAEIKKASPSAGIIANDFNHKIIAKAYADEADAVSILTDVQYFQGKSEYISDVRNILRNTPILRKDFIIRPVQIYETRALGADSFLLISSILTLSEMKEFIDIGRSLGMEPLVESHSREELEKTIDSSAQIMGINNRNLKTFKVDLVCSEDLIRYIPNNVIAISESGIKTKEDAMRLKSAEFAGILVGETLMRSGVNHCKEYIKAFKGDII